MIEPAHIAAYAASYKALRERCRMIVPSCREDHPYFKYLAEARAYLAFLLASFTVQQRTKTSGRPLRGGLE